MHAEIDITEATLYQAIAENRFGDITQICDRLELQVNNRDIISSRLAELHNQPTGSERAEYPLTTILNGRDVQCAAYDFSILQLLDLLFEAYGVSFPFSVFLSSSKNALWFIK